MLFVKIGRNGYRQALIKMDKITKSDFGYYFYYSYSIMLFVKIGRNGYRQALNYTNG